MKLTKAHEKKRKVPASSPRMLSKSLGLTSDNITYDLEDSVTPSAKPAARTALREHLAGLSRQPPPPGVSELAVRINAVSTPHALDDRKWLFWGLLKVSTGEILLCLLFFSFVGGILSSSALAPSRLVPS